MIANCFDILVAVREHISQDLRFSQFFSLPIVLYVCQKLWHWRERKSKTKKKHDVMKELHTPLSPDGKKSFYVLTQMLVLIQFERGWPIQTRGKMLRCVRKIISNKIWIWSNILLGCADFINLGMWQFQIFTTNQLGCQIFPIWSWSEAICVKPTVSPKVEIRR